MRDRRIATSLARGDLDRLIAAVFERFPCFTGTDRPPPLVDDDGPRTPSMSRARIERDLPELLDATRLLVERRLSYEDALARYFPLLLGAYGGDRSRIFSFDGIHEQYI